MVTNWNKTLFQIILFGKEILIIIQFNASLSVLICLDEFYFRWLGISVIEIGKAVSIPLIFNHLKWKTPLDEGHGRRKNAALLYFSICSKLKTVFKFCSSSRPMKSIRVIKPIRKQALRTKLETLLKSQPCRQFLLLVSNLPSLFLSYLILPKINKLWWHHFWWR